MTFRRTTKFLAARHDPEVRARISAACKAAWADPEVRARQSAVMTTVWADPDLRARQSARIREALADPEVRARRRAVMTRAWADPELRARHSESAKIRAALMRARVVEAPRWVVIAGLQNVFFEVAAQSDEIDAARHCRLLTAEMRKARAAPGEEA